MTVVANIMFAGGFGGVEQVFCDYYEALTSVGIKVINIARNDAKVLQMTKVNYIPKSVHYLDFRCARFIAEVIDKENITHVFCHGGRAVLMSKRAKKYTKNKFKLIAITHNYFMHKQLKADELICLTNDLKNHAIKLGYPAAKIWCIPNMIKLPETKINVKPYHKVPVIGAIGRFIEKKGFDVLLRALKILQSQNIEFKAIIGGDGYCKHDLMMLARELELMKQVEFQGWVTDRESFYSQIDIFCLPSKHEPFGVVLLEAGSYLKPIVSCAAEGPREIIKDKQTGLLAKISDAKDLADKLKIFISDQKKGQEIAKNFYSDIVKRYSLKVVAKLLKNVLKDNNS